MRHFIDIYESKISLTNKLAKIFYAKNKTLLDCMCIDENDIIQMFLYKFYKYDKDTFLENCESDKYWCKLCLLEFRKCMLQEWKKAEYRVNKDDIQKANKIIVEVDDEDLSEYEYLKDLIQNEETRLWLQGKSKREIGHMLYGKQDNSGNITRKINIKINEDILNIQEHLGIKKRPINNAVYDLQNKVIELHLLGLTNIEIATKLNKTNHQINNIIYKARKSGKIQKQDSPYSKKKQEILNYIKYNPNWTYYKIRILFNTDTATIKRYMKDLEEV